MRTGYKIAFGFVKLALFGGTVGGIAYLAQKAIEKQTKLKERYKSYYATSNQWLLNKNDNKDISEYFKENEYKTIAIYGMGTMGDLFYQEIKKTDIKVAYFIDKDADELYYGVDDIAVVGLNDISSQEKVDAIIVTPVYDFDEISNDLENLNLDASIISLEDVIYEI